MTQENPYEFPHDGTSKVEIDGMERSVAHTALYLPEQRAPKREGSSTPAKPAMVIACIDNVMCAFPADQAPNCSAFGAYVDDLLRDHYQFGAIRRTYLAFWNGERFEPQPSAMA